MAREEQDPELEKEANEEALRLEQALERLEMERMFSGPNDNDPCYMDIQSGSGGTEAQDWAEMVMRMYIKFGEKHGFNVTVTELSDGEVAGIKSATLRFEGDHAYGWFRTETGVHRLVRKSPFDSNNRRHTSFCSAYVYPEIDDNIEIDINPADLRVDVYRSSGAGGQHVNKTESAVRITHIPTGIVVSCQNERSQFQNRDQAMKQLRARLYTLELEKRKSVQKEIEDNKSDIGWGSQIRSYVLDDSRIKDLRTGVECRDTQKVLNGDLDQFIEASLKSGLYTYILAKMKMAQENIGGAETLNNVMQERRGKLEQLRTQGQAYPNDFRRDALSSDIFKACADKDNETLEKEQNT